MDKAEFWATKSKQAEFHAIEFDHPAFEAPFRLVANQFTEVTLGGAPHVPAPMRIKPPDEKSDVRPKLTLGFPRPVVGREFKKQLRRVTDSGLLDPIQVSYGIYLGDTSAPKVTWRLFADETNGVTFNRDSVQVVAGDDNIMRRGVSVIYDPGVFTGLELL
jgi:hypothetical protein